MFHGLNKRGFWSFTPRALIFYYQNSTSQINKLLKSDSTELVHKLQSSSMTSRPVNKWWPLLNNWYSSIKEWPCIFYMTTWNNKSKERLIWTATSRSECSRKNLLLSFEHSLSDHQFSACPTSNTSRNVPNPFPWPNIIKQRMIRDPEIWSHRYKPQAIAHRRLSIKDTIQT